MKCDDGEDESSEVGDEVRYWGGRELGGRWVSTVESDDNVSFSEGCCAVFFVDESHKHQSLHLHVFTHQQSRRRRRIQQY